MSAVIIHPQVVGHTPHAHADHNNQVVPCGCWTRESRLAKLHRFYCECGATYEREEVLLLAKWRCYDCGIVYARSPAGVHIPVAQMSA